MGTVGRLLGCCQVGGVKCRDQCRGIGQKGCRHIGQLIRPDDGVSGGYRLLYTALGTRAYFLNGGRGLYRLAYAVETGGVNYVDGGHDIRLERSKNLGG